MTIPANVPSVQYTGTASLATYAVPFKFFQNADLVVQTQSVAGVLSTLVLTTDYTLVGAGLPAGGTITLVAGNLAAGVILVISRAPSPIQGASLPNGGSYFGNSIEAALDLLTMVAQSLQAKVGRAALLSVTDAGAAPTVPALAARAGHGASWDASGNFVAGAGALLGSVSYLFVGLQFNGTYVLIGRANSAFTITSLNRKCTGTVTLAVQINGVSITGLSAVAASSVRATATASAANVVAVGDLITIILSAGSVDLADLDITLGVLE